MTDDLTELVDAARIMYEAAYRFDIVAAETLGIHRSDLRCINLLRTGGLSAGEIAERLGMASGSVTALIDRLERAGFVVRERSPEDNRRVLVTLKPGFYHRAKAVYQKLGDALRDGFSDMEPGELALAAEVVRRLARGFDDAVAAQASPDMTGAQSGPVAVRRRPMRRPERETPAATSRPSRRRR